MTDLFGPTLQYDMEVLLVDGEKGSVRPSVIATPDSTTSPLKTHGPASNLADRAALELIANDELILADGSGNGYRHAEIAGTSNPSGWSGVLKAKTPTGVSLGYILLYSTQ